MSDFGKVYLIGAGPGDPGLFTLRGKAILERADVVVYDRLVSPSILAFCNDNAQMVDVGKMPTHHKVKQSEINKLLVKFAKEMPCAVIARLKGGDPFVFGRGGEEALELVEAGVEFEVVPGVTSAISVPAYAGIPVSHRGIATSFHIITGHEKEEVRGSRPEEIKVESDAECHPEQTLQSISCHPEQTLQSISCHPEQALQSISCHPEQAQRVEGSSIAGLDFPALAKCPGTLIFLMGISNMQMIARRLMECGKDPKTPLAFIEKGTTPYQRTVTCTLETAAETIVRENVVAPAITIMGGVVELGDKLAWRKNLPLSGKRLVVTRAAKQASGISAKLTALGAEVIETPMIETRSVEPRVDTCHPEQARRSLSCHPEQAQRSLSCHPEQAQRSLSCHPERSTKCEVEGSGIANFADLANFDVLAFTSTNGVESFFDAFFKAGLDIRALADKKIASVGKITEKKLLERGLHCDFVPEDHTGEGLGKLLAKIAQSSNLEPGASTLLLQGNLADDTLTTLLPKVTRWVVYETLPAKTLPDWKREAVAAADAVVFASSSAVENFAKVIQYGSVESHAELDSASASPCLEPQAPCPAPRTCFSIGRMTTATAKKYGFDVIESDETTMDSLVKKIAEYYA
ncbi:MAG: uroporphyrinogen-III C-methyltransferase [Fibrobacter sp.]|nr:uroporphyrinogen-III C-methyltransferase [Fibrobacter sp.]